MIIAQIFVDVCGMCAEYGDGTWEWWLRGCWKYDCPPAVGLMAMGVTMAALVAVQIAARRQK